MSKRMIFFFLALVFMGEFALYAETPEVRASFTADKIVLDGQLKEKIWQNTPEYHLVLLNTGNIPFQKTIFKVVYNKNNLFFGIIAYEDNMGKLKAEVTNRDGTVWFDDDIEIFLDPWGKHQDYYQFAFNTLGTQFDLLGKEGGKIKTSFWNAFWQVKVYKGRNFWSAEVAIPFGSLNLTGAKKNWYFNLTRARFSGGKTELSTFVPLVGGFHQPAKFAALTGLRFDKNIYTSIRIGEAEASVYPANSSWNIYLSLPIYSKKRREKINLEVLDNEKGKIVVEKEKDLTYGLNEVGFSFPVSQLGKRNLVFLLKNKEGRLLKSSFQEIKTEYHLVDVDIIKPFYRNSIYPTQKEKTIEALFKINKEVIKKIDSANILLVSMTGKKIVEKVYFPKERILFRYDAKNLPTGRYELSISLFGKKGGKIGGKTTLISVLPPPQNGTEVRIDKNLNVLINGKPFLAIGWYGGWWRSNLKKRDDIFTPEVNLGREGSYHLAGMDIRRLIPGTKEYKESDRLSEEAKKAIREKVISLKNDPLLIGYYLADEPEVGNFNPSWLKAEYEYVKSLDPYRFCYLTNDTPDGIVKYIEAADLLNPDPYLSPVKGQKITNMSKIKMFLRTIDEVGKGRKAKWVTLQAFNYGDYGQIKGRPPTYIEERTMWFLSLACGAKGFTPYMFIEYGEYPDLRIGIPYIHKEVKSLEKVILSPGKGKELKLKPEKPEITTWLKEYEGNIYIIAVNTSPDTIKVRMSQPFLKRYKKLYVISEDRVIPLKDGAFTDSFGYVATHVYTTNPQFPRLKNIRAVQEEIKTFRSRLQKPGNLAYEGNGTMLRSSGNYPPKGDIANLHWVVNGITDGMGWYDTSRKFPAWLELLFPREVTVGRTVIYTPALLDYEVQGWNPEEGKWVVLAKVKNQRLDPIGPEPTRIALSFHPIKTVKLRLIVYRSRGITEVNEWEVYAK